MAETSRPVHIPGRRLPAYRRRRALDAMANLLGDRDTRLWRVLMHYVEQAHAKSDWSAVRRIAVDETSARRGHRYVTDVLNELFGLRWALPVDRPNPPSRPPARIPIRNLTSPKS
jgi:hypothetical protein